MLRAVPNISPAETCLGIWSTVVAEKTLRVPERLHERPPVEQGVEVVGVRVAEVDGDGVAAVLVEQRPQAAVDLREGLVPRDLLEAGAGAHQRRADPVRVLVQRLQREALGADEAVAEDVLCVAADLGQHAVLERQLEPAGRLAQRAGAVGGDRLGHKNPLAPDPTAEESVAACANRG